MISSHIRRQSLSLLIFVNQLLSILIFKCYYTLLICDITNKHLLLIIILFQLIFLFMVICMSAVATCCIPQASDSWIMLDRVIMKKWLFPRLFDTSLFCLISVALSSKIVKRLFSGCVTRYGLRYHNSYCFDLIRNHEKRSEKYNTK